MGEDDGYFAVNTNDQPNAWQNCSEGVPRLMCTGFVDGHYAEKWKWLGLTIDMTPMPPHHPP